MRLPIYVLAIVAAALSLAGTALADPGHGGGNGNGVTVEHYRTAYNDVFFGPISCAGVHQTGKNFGQWGQDSFTCSSTTGNPLADVFPGQQITQATTGGWFSDYWYWIHSPSTVLFATSLTGQVSDDGTSFTAVANY